MPRIVDELIEQYLREFGAVEVRGPRWCGKSWTSMAFGNSVTRVDENTSIYLDDPSLALVGDRPHVIDEWQDVPAIWNSVRRAVDDSGSAAGLFLLTGSSSPLAVEEEGSRHSGAGRIARLKMSTMTLQELGMSSGLVSLAGLFRGELIPCTSGLGLAEIATHICRGGWPGLASHPDRSPSRLIGQYLDALFEASIAKAGKSPMLARRIALSLARNAASSAKLETIATDAASGDGGAPTPETVSSYIREFKRNYFVEELPGWDAPVRAKSRLRTKPKRYLADPSLVTSLLGVNEERILGDSQLFGLLFESLAIHDLAVYAQCLPHYTRESLRYYSDADGLEVDVIIELSDGRWAGIEIKTGESKVPEAIKSLRRLRAKVASNPLARNPDPAFMAVLLGKGTIARYDREGDAYVIPIGTLGV